MNNTDIKTSQELKEFLEGLEFKQVEGLLSPIYLTSVMNYIFSLDNINSLMTDENKEIAKRLWQIAKLKGVQLGEPAILN
ncbi:MAG: hypothetical protein SPJ04_06125 [Bdellovibrionota bacterium]|nr:hypothetical protein [Pseudomonadota bacterium]MDY6090813.1 hypothetical protein [Bdellovibrionota bacterium]